MQQPSMRACTQLLVKTCVRRGVHRMGGMAAQIPINNDSAKNHEAIAKVRAAKLGQVKNGTLVRTPIAKVILDEHMDVDVLHF